MGKSNLLFDLPRPVIFAHRGASRFAPENTLVAFELAVQQRADAVELDAKLTADGHIVVFHDETLDRTTSASGKIGEKKLTELKELDAGSYFDSSYRNERIPTLEEVFDAVGQRIFINIELTNYASPYDQLPEKVAELVKKHNLDSRVMTSSFNPFALIKIKRLLPGVPFGLLALEGKSGRWARSWIGTLLNYPALHPAYSDVDNTLVGNAHRQNRRVHPYTVNEVEVMQCLLNWDVDGIFTDDPILARQIFSRDAS
jgi:glycerophosphoryl diester phosphodiesterase